jgi:hypothetical protein
MSENAVLRNSNLLAEELLREQGIRPYSLMGGERAKHFIAWGIDRAREDDRQRRADSPGESIRFVEGDWAFDIDEEQASDEAWWVDLQLLDPRDVGSWTRRVAATLSLSDVELEGLIKAAQDILAEGRRRFS